MVEQLLAGKQIDKEVIDTADENASPDKHAETGVAQTDIKHGDLPMINDNVDTDILTTARERVLKYL